MKHHGKKFGALMCLILFVGLSLSAGAGADWAVKNYESETIIQETGTTDAFEGGDYVYIRFKNDAGFGVLYGTEDDPNSIIIV
ncbi:MAG: hypothetical protein KAI64_07660, partial [Thermoplasmata archaeon]|nr:hypothetical protein [Thermoplasmata archaeon]